MYLLIISTILVALDSLVICGALPQRAEWSNGIDYFLVYLLNHI